MSSADITDAMNVFCKCKKNIVIKIVNQHARVHLYGSWKQTN